MTLTPAAPPAHPGGGLFRDGTNPAGVAGARPRTCGPLDGSGIYFTNSLYGAWDEQFYPDGVGAWMAKLDVSSSGGVAFDPRFFVEGEAFRGRRAHQVRLRGSDASSDSSCYRS